jgi:hypothetical protein
MKMKQAKGGRGAGALRFCSPLAQRLGGRLLCALCPGSYTLRSPAPPRATSGRPAQATSTLRLRRLPRRLHPMVRQRQAACAHYVQRNDVHALHLPEMNSPCVQGGCCSAPAAPPPPPAESTPSGAQHPFAVAGARGTPAQRASSDSPSASVPPQLQQPHQAYFIDPHSKGNLFSAPAGPLHFETPEPRLPRRRGVSGTLPGADPGGAPDARAELAPSAQN